MIFVSDKADFNHFITLSTKEIKEILQSCLKLDDSFLNTQDF